MPCHVCRVLGGIYRKRIHQFGLGLANNPFSEGAELSSRLQNAAHAMYFYASKSVGNVVLPRTISRTSSIVPHSRYQTCKFRLESPRVPRLVPTGGVDTLREVQIRTASFATGILKHTYGIGVFVPRIGWPANTCNLYCPLIHIFRMPSREKKRKVRERLGLSCHPSGWRLIKPGKSRYEILQCASCSFNAYCYACKIVVMILSRPAMGDIAIAA